MYKEALQTSANAAGTLNEQQDIFMESTTAHLQQMRTAAEGVYDSLLNVKTINTLVDGLTKILQVVEKLTDGLGGLDGILQQLVPLATSFASKYLGQIAGSVYNNLTIPKQNRQAIDAAMSNVQYVTRNIDDTLLQQSGNKELLQQKEQLLSNAGYLTPESLSSALTIMNEYAETLQRTNIEIDNVKSSVNEWNKAQTDATLKVDLNDKSLEEQEDELRRVKKELEQYGDIIKKDAENLQKFIEIGYSSPQKAGIKSLGATIDVNDLKNNVKSFTKYDFNAGEYFGKYEIPSQYQEAEKAAKDYIDAYIDVINGKIPSMNDATSKIKEKLASILKDSNGTLKADGKQLISDVIQNLNTELMKANLDSKAAASIKKQLANLLQGNGKTSFDDMPQKTKAEAEKAINSYFDSFNNYLNGKLSADKFNNSSGYFRSRLLEIMTPEGKEISKKSEKYVNSVIDNINKTLASKTIDSIPLVQKLLGDQNLDPAIKESLEKIKQKYGELLNEVSKGSISSKDALGQLRQEFIQMAKQAGESEDRAEAEFNEFINTITRAKTEVNGVKSSLENLKNINFQAVFTKIASAASAFTSVSTGAAALGKSLASRNLASGLTSLASLAYGAGNAVKFLSESFSMAVGAAGLVTAGIAIVIAILGAVQQNLDNAAESARQMAEEQKKISDTAIESADKAKEAVKSYEDLNKQYQDGAISIEELRTSTYDLLKSYGEEDEAVKTLYASYDDLNGIMKEYRDERLKTAEVEAQKTQELLEQSTHAAVVATGMKDTAHAALDWTLDSAPLIGLFTNNDTMAYKFGSSDLAKDMKSYMKKNDLTDWFGGVSDLDRKSQQWLVDHYDELEKFQKEYYQKVQESGDAYAKLIYDDVVQNLGRIDSKVLEALKAEKANEAQLLDIKAQQVLNAAKIDEASAEDYETLRRNILSKLIEVYNGEKTKEEIEQIVHQFFLNVDNAEIKELEQKETFKKDIDITPTISIRKATPLGGQTLSEAAAQEEKAISSVINDWLNNLRPDELNIVSDNQKFFKMQIQAAVDGGEDLTEILNELKDIIDNNYLSTFSTEMKKVSDVLISEEGITKDSVLGFDQDLLEKFSEEYGQSFSDAYKEGTSQAETYLLKFYEWLNTQAKQSDLIDIEDLNEELEKAEKRIKNYKFVASNFSATDIGRGKVYSAEDFQGVLKNYSSFEDFEKALYSNEGISFNDGTIRNDENVKELSSIDEGSLEDIKNYYEQIAILENNRNEIADEINEAEEKNNKLQKEKENSLQNQLDTLKKIIDLDLAPGDKSAKKAKKTLTSAEKELEKNGYLSSDTLRELNALGDEYWEKWHNINGEIEFQSEEIKNLEKLQAEKDVKLAEEALLDAKILYYQEKMTTANEETLATLDAQIKDLEKTLSLTKDIAASTEKENQEEEETTKPVKYTKAIVWENKENDYNYIDQLLKDNQQKLTALRDEMEYLSGDALKKAYEEENQLLEERLELYKQLNKENDEKITDKTTELQQLGNQFGVNITFDENGYVTPESMKALNDLYNSKMSGYTSSINSVQRNIDEASAIKDNQEQTAEYQNQKTSIQNEQAEFKAGYDKLLSLAKEINQLQYDSKGNLIEINKLEQDISKNEASKKWIAFDEAVEQSNKDIQHLNKVMQEMEKDNEYLDFEGKMQNAKDLHALQLKQIEEYEKQMKMAHQTIITEFADTIKNSGINFDDLLSMDPVKIDALLMDVDKKIQDITSQENVNEEELAYWTSIRDRLQDAYDISSKYKDVLRDVEVNTNKVKEATDQIETSKIDHTITTLNRELNTLKKAQSSLKGQALINNLKQQLAVQQKIVAQEQKKLVIMKQQSQQRANEMNKMLAENNIAAQIKFNEDGSLANYYEIVALIENTVGLTRQQRDILLDNLNILNKTADATAKQYNAIQSAKDAAEDIAKEIKDKLKEELAKAFNAKVDVEVNIEDAWRNLHKLRAELDGLKDDDYFGNMNLQLKQLTEYLNTNPNSTLPGGSTQILTQHLQDIMSEIRTMQGGGTSKIYGTDQSAAFSDLQNYRDQLGSNVQSMMDSVKEMKQTYLSAIDTMISANDKFIQSIDKMNSILNNTMNIIKLVYGDDSYKKMDKYLRMSAQLAMNSATAARNNADNYRARMLSSTTEEEYRKWADAWTGAIDSVYSHMESAIKALSELAENNFKKIAASFTDQWKEIGENGLPLSISWEYEKTKVKDFYDYTNSMYQKDSLSRKIQKAIDEATDPTTINALQDAYANIIGYLDESIKKNKQLSKYEIERANKLYELTLKQIALEDERDNKTKMRLRRDQVGNYRYEYVADDEKVAQSEEDVEKAKNDLYNLAYNRAVSASDSINTYTEQMTKQLSEAAKMYNGDPEQLQTEFKKIYNKYNGLIKAAQNDIALSEQDLKKYGLETDSDFLNVLDHTQNFKSGLTEEQLDQIFGENVNYYEMMRALGVDTEQMAESDMATAQDISDYYEYYANKLADQVDQTKLIVDQLEAMEPMLKSLAETALATYQQSLYFREQDAAAIGADSTDANGSSGLNLVVSNRATAGGTLTYDYDPDSGRVFMRNEDRHNEAGRKKLEAMYGAENVRTDAEWSEYARENQVTIGGFTRQKRTDSYNESRNKNGVVESSAALAEAEAIKSANKRKEIYDKTVKIAAETAKKGGTTAGIFQELQGIGAMLAEPQPLEQHVQIDAQFQGKTKETEIFEALKGLVNRAAQVAENNGK